MDNGKLSTAPSKGVSPAAGSGVVRTDFFKVRKAFFVVFILGAALMASCNPAKKFVIVDFDAPRMQGLGALKGELVVDSDSRRDLVVERAEISVHVRGREVASARLSEAIKVPRREISKVSYRLELEKVSFSALGSLTDRALRNPDAVTVDITARVRHGGTAKKIHLKNVPLSEIIGTFDER